MDIGDKIYFVQDGTGQIIAIKDDFIVVAFEKKTKILKPLAGGFIEVTWEEILEALCSQNLHKS